MKKVPGQSSGRANVGMLVITESNSGPRAESVAAWQFSILYPTGKKILFYLRWSKSKKRLLLLDESGALARGKTGGMHSKVVDRAWRVAELPKGEKLAPLRRICATLAAM